MFTHPDHLPDDRVVDALRAGWGLAVGRIEYVPLGFGSYHWRVEVDDGRRFVTIDDLAALRRSDDEEPGEPRRRLSAARTTARSLRHKGLTFVVAPTPTNSGDVVHVVNDRFAVAVYPFIDGTGHEWGAYPTREERLAVLGLLVAVHGATGDVDAATLVDDYSVPSRDELAGVLDDLATPWNTGPFGEPARQLVEQQAAIVRELVEQYDALVATVQSRGGSLVVTHGEPHRGNTITTADGVVLIDWDTALLAPPERDLWSLADEDPQILDDYTTRTGVTPNADALELYRRWWELTEIALAVDTFRDPHQANDDTAMEWKMLRHYLDADRQRRA